MIRPMNATAAVEVRQHILDIAKPIMLCKGFSAVGLNEILAAAGVPKGSFYHYFGSKESFGGALLESYFTDYLDDLDGLLQQPGSGADRLMRYWNNWFDTQVSHDPAGKCLVVKLGAEVCDLSEAMRVVLQRGTERIVERLSRCIADGIADGSISGIADPRHAAATLYQLWLGATLIEKIRHDRQSLDTAMTTTRQLLNLSTRADPARPAIHA
jgi:TetR/AcrR family transcriptional regulator, transcriptional repressor for nem operon